MSPTASSPAVLAVQPIGWCDSCSYTTKRRLLKRGDYFFSHTCNLRIISGKNKLLTNTCSILLGIAATERLPRSVNAMIARHLRRWQACRRRRKRRKNDREAQYMCSNSKKYKNNAASRSVINGRKTRNGVISCHATCSNRNNNNNRNNRNNNNGHRATSKQSFLLEDYTESGLLQARNSIWPQAAAAEVEEVNECIASQTGKWLCFVPETTTTRTTTTAAAKRMSKLVKCERLTSKRKQGPQQQQQQLQQRLHQQQMAKPQPTALEYLPAFVQQEKQQQQLQQAERPQFAATFLCARLQADIAPTSVADGNSKIARMQYDRLEEEQQIAREHQKQQQLEQQHCLQVPGKVEKRQASNEIAYQRSWRNLIGCVAGGTNATCGTTTTTIKTTRETTKSARETTVLSNTATATATPTANVDTKATCSTVGCDAKATVPIAPTGQTARTARTATKSATAIVTTMKTLPTLQHVPCVAARKSKCRRTFALTSALTTTTTTATTTATTEKIMAIKAAKTTVAKDTTATTTILAKSRIAAATLFVDVLALFVGALTLHATGR